VADENEDPREVPWHPRHAAVLIGHAQAQDHFLRAFTSGKPHHAWLLHGPKGIGKATLAYHLAGKVLGDSAQSRRWIEAKAHPDLFVLERQLNDSKPTRKLKSEISVEDARGLSSFFSHTASGSWRVAIIDAADDLNTESANAILKLVEEPPAKCLIFLISHQPGRLLRTLKSRCLRLGLELLQSRDVLNIINALPLETKPDDEQLARAVAQSQGSPGQALTLLTSVGAKAFAQFAKLSRPKPSDLIAVSNQLAGRGIGPDEFSIFTQLLLDWMAQTAKTTSNAKLAEAHQIISENARIAQGFNLDRKQAAMAQLKLVNEALKAS
jgi:DNA polymerase III subunit delta'